MNIHQPTLLFDKTHSKTNKITTYFTGKHLHESICYKLQTDQSKIPIRPEFPTFCYHRFPSLESKAQTLPKKQNGSLGCHFHLIRTDQSALRRGPNGSRQRNRLLRVARHWFGRPRICCCRRVSSLSITSSLWAQAWV